MSGRRRYGIALASIALVLSFFIFLLTKHWSPSRSTNLGVAAPVGMYVVSSESQPYTPTSHQSFPGHSHSAASSHSSDRAIANRPPAVYHGDTTAVNRDKRAQSTQLWTNHINVTADQTDGATYSPSSLSQHKLGLQNNKQKNIKQKPRLSVCDPEGITGATALGFQPLSKSTVEGVEKFVFFVGYPRSGHSIIASAMDAHPDIVIAHEYFLFSKYVSQLKGGASIFNNETQLFNDLYKNSYFSSKCGWRSASNTSKGYNLEVKGQWQGAFHQLRVVGDKSGGNVAAIMQSGTGSKCIEQMKERLHMPIIGIHVVRNPYDMIATSILYQLSTVKYTKASDVLHRKLRPHLNIQISSTKRLFSEALAVAVVSKKITVIEIHIEDHIKDPRNCVLKICSALEVLCPQDYVEECYQKAYRNVSRSRDLIEWEPVVIHRIQEGMKMFPFFHGYTFENDFRL